ncbi:RNA-directed DNA polymerase, eukaryota, reverse transcriptase zinc-binding domain protein [Tanacetum coccineum]
MVKSRDFNCEGIKRDEKTFDTKADGSVFTSAKEKPPIPEAEPPVFTPGWILMKPQTSPERRMKRRTILKTDEDAKRKNLGVQGYLGAEWEESPYYIGICSSRIIRKKDVMGLSSHSDFKLEMQVGAEAFNMFISIAGLEEIPLRAPVDDSDAMINVMKKLKYLKERIRVWINDKKKSSNNSNVLFKEELVELDVILGEGEGSWIDSPNIVKNEFLSHFKKRFDKPQQRRTHINMTFPHMITSDQNADLESDVTREEIKRAVWDCGIDKSPGLDGFTFGFYRRLWNVIEKDVVKVMRFFFNYGSFPKGGNSSFIALIPKNPDANMVKDFRPISLIGSLYKIIKFQDLANRLVVVLGDIVNEVQSAFVADRQILDGPFILNEVVQWCKAKKKQAMIFKVDFEKAYDSIR